LLPKHAGATAVGGIGIGAIVAGVIIADGGGMASASHSSDTVIILRADTITMTAIIPTEAMAGGIAIGAIADAGAIVAGVIIADGVIADGVIIADGGIAVARGEFPLTHI